MLILIFSAKLKKKKRKNFSTALRWSLPLRHCPEGCKNSAFGFVLHLIDLLSTRAELPYPCWHILSSVTERMWHWQLTAPSTPSPMSPYPETDFQNRCKYSALAVQQFSSQEMWAMTLQMRKAPAKGEFVLWRVSGVTSGRWLESIILLSSDFGSDPCLLSWFGDTFCGRFRIYASFAFSHIPEAGSQCRARNEKRGVEMLYSVHIFNAILREE